ncbi:MAG: hypothetical protein U0869_06065 [Chloroflexota bacterium]
MSAAALPSMSMKMAGAAGLQVRGHVLDQLLVDVVAEALADEPARGRADGEAEHREEHEGR